MGLRIGVIKSLFGSVSKKIGQETAKAPERMTRVFTDSSSGIVKMERSINRNGKEALATLEVSPNGSRRLRIEYSPGVSSERTTQITREKGVSVFGGDKVTIDKVYGHNDWGDNLKLVKEYSPQGVLEHKELHYNRPIEGHWPNHAVQDRVYNEYPLSSGYRDMISDPQASRYVKHVFNKENNYFRFADGSSTNYTSAIQAKEQAAIDAAKKIEAEALAAKEAAGKATAELRAKQPRINISKALNKDIAAATKAPISKKQLALKFVMAMAGVAASAVVIYVGLSFYNKLFREQSEPVVGLNSLRTPENFKESINLFLEKTNWG